MDGLLLDTEDIYTQCINIILAKHGRPLLPWSIKAKLQGRPGPEASKLLHDWAQLPISEAEYMSEYISLQRQYFPNAKALPGVKKLLGDLARTATAKHRVHIALATSSNSRNFTLKTSHLETTVFSVFQTPHRITGDDVRIQPGRGKPLPDIYLLALATINSSLPPDTPPIRPDECLVFEDSVPGVEAGRRAGMRVVWCPHPELKKHYAGREGDILAGRTGEAGVGVNEHQLGEVDDGWAQYVETLEDFPYERYGIVVPPKDAEVDEKIEA